MRNLTAYREAIKARKASKMPKEAKIRVVNVKPKAVEGKAPMPERTNSNKTH